MKKSGLLTGLFCLLISLSSGKQLGLSISYAQYLTADDQPYLELYFALNGRTLALAQNDRQMYRGGVEVTLMFQQDSLIKAADRFRILSPAVKDTTTLNEIFIQQERFQLAPGTYDLLMTISDIHNARQEYSIQQKIIVRANDKALTASDLIFLDSYKPAAEGSKYTKSGYELIPLVSSGNYYFPDGVKKLSFYVELYNLSAKLSPGTPYLLKYYIEEAGTQQMLSEYASFAKKKAEEVQPVLASFTIADLPTGNYNLVVEALDRQGEVLLQKKEFFFRKNRTARPIAIDNITEADISGTFADRINNFDSLYTYIRYLFPISEESQQNYQKTVLESRDKAKMKHYLYTFWYAMNPSDPGGEWKRYHREVKVANRLFGTRIQKGFMTSRGRVYLVYGAPDMVEDRKFEPALPPYEIWQYNQVDSKYAIPQTNRQFVFAEFELSTNDYELIHSTAFGELFDNRWKFNLANRGSGGIGNSIDSQSDDISQDGYGSRLNNNMIFKSRTESGQNR